MNEVSVGSRLKRAREQNSLTQAELAGKLGVSQGTIHNFEAGKSTPDSAMIAKLEAILGSGLLSIGPASGILEDASIVGAWLAKNRQKLGLTQQELAGKAGVSQVTVSHIENGISRDPHPKTIKLLEKALGEPFEHDAERELEEESEIRGVGRFTDFDPHDEKSWPSEPGIYVFYDISERPIYVGEAKNIAKRIKDHVEKYWWKPPIVESASYIPVKDDTLRGQIETALIKFMKKNAVLNKQQVDRR